MDKNYFIIGFVAVGGIALASSIFLFQDAEKNTPVAENLPTSEKIVQEVVISVQQMKTNSFVDSTETEPEIEVTVDNMEDMMLPDVGESIPHDLYDGPQTFWTVDKDEQGNDPEVYSLKVDPQMIANLQVGQTFDFYVPELNQTFQADINVTKNSFNGTHIFKGEITDGRFGENISIVRGKNLTFVTVATLQGVYSASVDNLTGKTLLQSEASLNKNLHGDDGIAVDVTEVVPPEA